MKFTLYTVFAFLIVGLSINCAYAQKNDYHKDVLFKDLKIDKHDSLINISMKIDLTKLNLASNSSLTFIPKIINGKNELILNSVTIADKKQYIYKQRNNEKPLPIKRINSTPQTINYAKTIKFEPWMAGARIIVTENSCGCLNNFVEGNNIDVGIIKKEPVFMPVFAYIQPVSEMKIQAGKISLNLSFPVAKTTLIPSFGSNELELRKIMDLYNKIKSNKYFTLKDVIFHGYASPEGSYALNNKLAAGRVKAVADYAKRILKLKDNIVTDYTAEDWAGVAKYVKNSIIRDKEAILSIINSDMAPDQKDKIIKTKYPDGYRELLQDCYPALRRTDCSISYKIRNLTLDECKQLFKKEPELLSLNEFFRLAELYPKGSDDFNSIFLIALKMFPDNPVANLNAANIALKENDLEKAIEYLKNTKESPQSLNAYGIYFALRGEHQEAINYFKKAAQQGLQAAETNIKSMQSIIDFNY